MVKKRNIYLTSSNTEELDLRVKRILFHGDNSVVFSGNKNSILFSENEIESCCPSITSNYKTTIDGEDFLYSRCDILELCFKRTAYSYEKFVELLKLELKATKIQIDYYDVGTFVDYYEVFYVDPEKIEVEINKNNLLVKVYSKDNWDIPYDKSVLEETL